MAKHKANFKYWNQINGKITVIYSASWNDQEYRGITAALPRFWRIDRGFAASPADCRLTSLCKLNWGLNLSNHNFISDIFRLPLSDINEFEFAFQIKPFTRQQNDSLKWTPFEYLNLELIQTDGLSINSSFLNCLFLCLIIRVVLKNFFGYQVLFFFNELCSIVRFRYFSFVKENQQVYLKIVISI